MIKVDPGDGYTLLKDGETVAAGDSFLWLGDEDAWIDVHPSRIGSKLSTSHAPHRRKIPGPTGIEAIVCADIAERQRLGVAKYGTTVKDNPLTAKQWAQHAYEECLDQAVYLRRLIDEL
jgi:hypothetical protein